MSVIDGEGFGGWGREGGEERGYMRNEEKEKGWYESG
jgi:hypothetical protein